MADLAVTIAGIRSPNPFWLASGPPTNSGLQVMRAFDAGWGGAVWKTLGNPIVNVSSRLGSIDYGPTRMMGLNNIELITDRPLAENLREIAEVKRRFPGNAVVVSLMFGPRAEWEDIVKRCEDTGCDGLELNFGCPHGMCERGMGSAVGQEPKVLQELVGWVRAATKLPILAKLTPNITDIGEPALAAKAGGADGVSLINTLQSIMGVDLDRLVPLPSVGRASSHGGYCGPAVKPVALRMVAQLGKLPEFGLPVSGIGGISTWQDAAEFLALGARTVQVCTAVMHHGFRIVEDLVDGLGRYLREKGFASVEAFCGAALPAFQDWGELDLNHHVVAKIDAKLCIGCQLCIVACHDGAHQCIHAAAERDAAPGAPGASLAPGTATRQRGIGGVDAAAAATPRVPWVDEPECVGCNLCALVCPVHGCITMVEARRAPEPESWNDRVRAGRDHVLGGLDDLPPRPR